MRVWQKGFTTVEIMITLFVGALFLISGYQLFAVINSSASRTREMAEASNIGYSVLRKEGAVSSSTTAPCSASSHPTTTAVRDAPTLQNLNISIKRCSPFSGSDITRVTVIVKYGNPQREVVHATYVGGS